MAAEKESLLKSRKFVAYMFADACWTILISGGLYRLEQILTADSNGAVARGVGIVTLLMTMTIVKGFIQAGYIGSQAWLDRYVKVAELTTGLAGGTRDTKPPGPAAEPPTGS